MSQETPTVVLVHGAFPDGFELERIHPAAARQRREGRGARQSAARISIDSAYTASVFAQTPGPILAVGHSFGGAVITNAAGEAANVVGLVYVAAFAPEKGERLGEAAAASKDSLLGSAQVPRQYPTANGGTAVEFAVDPAKIHEVFAADLPDELTPLLAATQRPVAELAFSEPNAAPAWKDLPSWAVVALSDKAAGTDVVRSMAERAGATITEVEGSHVIMISQPEAVTDVVLDALATVTAPAAVG